MKNIIVDINSTNNMINNGPSCVLVPVSKKLIEEIKEARVLVSERGFASISLDCAYQFVWSDYLSETPHDQRTDESYEEDISAIQANSVDVSLSEVVVMKDHFYIRSEPTDIVEKHRYESPIISFDVLDNNDRYVDINYFN